MAISTSTSTSLLICIAYIYYNIWTTTARALLEVSKSCVPCDNYERTFLMLKPDAVQRGLIGEIITRLEKKGLQLVAMKFMRPSEALAKAHYYDGTNEPLYFDLIKYITSGPVVPMVWKGCNAIKHTRLMIGGDHQRYSSDKIYKSGTIRGDYVTGVRTNLIHASDSVKNAEYEIQLWFNSHEVVDWYPIICDWI